RPRRRPTFPEADVAQRLIGQILIASGVITPEVLEQALAEQVTAGGRLGEILVEMRAASEEDVLKALGDQLGIGYRADLKNDEIDGDLATKVPIGFAKQHRLL